MSYESTPPMFEDDYVPCKTVEEATVRLDYCIAYFRENRSNLCRAELEDALLAIVDAKDELTALSAFIAPAFGGGK